MATSQKTLVGTLKKLVSSDSEKSKGSQPSEKKFKPQVTQKRAVRMNPENTATAGLSDNSIKKQKGSTAQK